MAHKYDLAVSFAGEQRDYVEAVVRACQEHGLQVFYDRDKNNEWWGGSFIRSQRSAYSSETRFFVPFLSTEYLEKPIPMDEFSSAMMTAVNQGDGYILPVLMPNTVVPPELLHPHIGYLRAEDYAPNELAEELVKKVSGAKAAGQMPAEIGPTVERALGVRMPKVVPHDWSKYQAIDETFDYVVKRFNEGAEQLKQVQMVCSVRGRDDNVSIRVERSGETVAGLDIRKGANMGDDHITWSVGTRMMSDNSWNGWAIAKFDRGSNQEYIEVTDMGLMTRSNSSPRVDQEGFFDFLWGLLIEQIER